MATKLDKVLKREIEIDGQSYIAALSPDGIKVTKKGFRKGNEISWRSIVSGEAQLNEDLNNSIEASSSGE
jgi:pyruvate/2-oxoacid:ferredoxin oxidoreductase beta subunit